MAPRRSLIAEARALEDMKLLNPLGTGYPVPSGFDSFVRVLHPVGRGEGATIPSVTWAEAAAESGRALNPLSRWRDLTPEPDRMASTEFAVWEDHPAHGSLPRRQAEAIAGAVDSLTPPGPIFYGVWEGWADLRDDLRSSPSAPRFEFALLTFLIIEGTRADAGANYAQKRRRHQSSSLWWPASREWVVHTYIEAASTVVACDDATADAILRAPDIEAFRLSAEQVGRLYCGYEFA